MFIVLGVIFNLLVGLYWICLTRKSEGNPLPIPTDQRSFIISLSPPPLLLFAPLQLPTRDWRPLRPRHFSEKAETVQVHVTLDSEGPRAKEIPHRAMKHLHAFLLHGGLWILVFHGLAEGGQTRIPANQVKIRGLIHVVVWSLVENQRALTWPVGSRVKWPYVLYRVSRSMLTANNMCSVANTQCKPTIVLSFLVKTSEHCRFTKVASIVAYESGFPSKFKWFMTTFHYRNVRVQSISK